MKKNIVVLYHNNCTDGFSGAWVAWKKFGKSANYIGVLHQTMPPNGLADKTVYIIDFCYEKELMKDIKRISKKLIVIDHHISAKNSIKESDEYVFNNNKSGAVLAWEYFYPNKKVPKLLQYVQDRDLWNWKLPMSKELLLFININEYDFKTWTKLARNFENTKKRREYYKIGKQLLNYQSSLVKRASLFFSKASLSGYKAFVVNSALFESEIGALLVEKGADVGIIWHKTRNGVRVSLRSGPNVDVSKIAKKYGGGGHKQAAGFLVSQNKKVPWKYEKQQ